ncbi:MAG: YeeE/YedE thiosulfate transporter family protein, partial [Gemmatimonadota bacterium]
MSNAEEVKKFINPYLAGILLGLVLFGAYFLTGTGLGASGGMARLVVSAQDLVAPRHVDRVGHLVEMAGGELNPLDHWIVLVTLGTLLGGGLSAFLNGR